MDLHADILARAKGAAHPGEVEAHFLGRQGEAGPELLLVGVEPLGRDEQVDATIGGRHREAGFRTERCLVLHAGLVAAFYPHLGAGVGIAVDDGQRTHHVALRVDGGGRFFERLLHVGDRGHNLVVDGDLLDRGAGQFEILGGDDRHRLTLVADDVHRENRLVLHVEPEGLYAGHIGVSQHGPHAGRVRSGRGIDRHDLGMWMGTAQGRPPQHPIAMQVAGVLELTLHLGDAINALDRLANATLATDIDAHLPRPLTPTLPRNGGGSLRRAAQVQ